MAVRGSVLQYKQQLFYGWRCEVVKIKKQNLNLKLMAWDSLNKNYQRKKHKKKMVQLILRIQNSNKEKHTRMYFYTLLRVVRKNVHRREHKILKKTVQPVIDECEGSINETNQRMVRLGLKKNTLVMRDCVNRWIYEYFAKWKYVTIDCHIKN